MSDKKLPGIDNYLQSGHKDMTPFQLNFVKKLSNQNIKRIETKILHQKKNRYIGLTLGGTALAIYGYTMYRFNLENFLDNFDEP